MPPRHRYWTIILEGKPTAFRAATPEDLTPTLRQLQVRHPDAVMKWFARGRLWESQEQEHADAFASRRPAEGERRAPSGDRRTRDWRPGGEHKDPRDRFKVTRDEKRRRFAENLRREWPDKPRDEPQENGRPPRTDTPRGDRPQFDRPPRDDRPRFNRPPQTDRGGKPPWKRDNRPPDRDQNRRPDWKPPASSDRPREDHRKPGSRPPGRPPGGGWSKDRPPAGRPPGGSRPGGSDRPG
jgi:hypothetical protein